MNAERPIGTRRQDAPGFALILAILALMLLTFLGLTLATTSSTELQIATNYRWSQQALYNAEAGMEAGKLLLANVASGAGNWAGIVPTNRTGTWNWGDTSTSSTPTGWPGSASNRDFERSGNAQETARGITGCRGRGGRMGYGVVLVASAPDGSSPTGGRWENVSVFMGQRLNGAFTLWVRRRLTVSANGTYTDDATNPPDQLVLTAEGVAPYASSQATTAQGAFTRANQAVRVLEMTYTLATRGQGCSGAEYAQQGGSASGENFNPCARLGDNSTDTAYAAAAGQGRVSSTGMSGAGTGKKLP